MNRQDAEKTITEYLKPIFGFALKRCKNLPDAEDLSQEIVLKAFRALLVREDIADVGKFIWTIAHNALSNYYRDTARSIIGVPIDEMAELLADPHSPFFEAEDNSESLHHLQSEIAYLSKLQRQIVIMYYFENRRQADIAANLGIPLGTVKWHLFEAKKELKRGMDTMRKSSDLKFNPIKFHSYGFNGSTGKKNPEDFFRSTLTQNICYCVRDAAKTVNEIASDLGVSPVYVESEVEYLEEYGFLQAQKDKYIINFIISEPSEELLIMQDKMYKEAAGLFANDLYDELVNSGILNDPAILCGRTDGPVSPTEADRADHNFLLWSLIPYIAAWSGEGMMDKSISFEEAATIRPDGGQNILHAAVVPDNMVLPEDYVYMKNWCGPMWNGDDRQTILWQIDSEWSDRPKPGDRNVADEHQQILALYHSEKDGEISKADYTWLAERGYIKTNVDADGQVRAAWQILILQNSDIRNRLLAIGNRIKEKYKADFDRIKAPYAKATLQSVPKHLQKIKDYELQYVFYSDGWFLLHCVNTLLNNGKLKPPTESQRKSLSTILICGDM